MYFNIDYAYHADLHYIFVITVVRRDSFWYDNRLITANYYDDTNL